MSDPDMITKIDSLKQEAATLLEQEDEQRKRLAELLKKLNAKQVKHKSEDSSSPDDEIDELKEKIAELEDEIAELKAARKQCMDELDNLQKELKKVSNKQGEVDLIIQQLENLGMKIVLMRQ